jgi:hypothetical protein
MPAAVSVAAPMSGFSSSTARPIRFSPGNGRGRRCFSNASTIRSAMVTYLEDLYWSDIARCRRDNRKELNLAISVIARVVMQNGQKGYLSGPGFYPAFEQFVQDWQDPTTGFFRMTYITDVSGNTARTTDLSLTVHMAHYVPHLIRWWPKLIRYAAGDKRRCLSARLARSRHNDERSQQLRRGGAVPSRLEPHRTATAHRGERCGQEPV